MNKLFVSILILSIFIISINDCGCSVENEFYDWVGSTYSITSTEECFDGFSLIGCNEKICMPNTDIFEAAIINTGWDWNDDNCNTNFKTGSDGSDDMVCSNPFTAKLSELPQGIEDIYFYDRLFHPACKIHDMCYKTNGNNNNNDGSFDYEKDYECDDQFGHNMKEICKMAYPSIISQADKILCDTAAISYQGATHIGGKHRGGINADKCKKKNQNDNESTSCHKRGPCNSGYMDITDGNYYIYYMICIDVDCQGGDYWTDNECNCACIPAPSSCTDNANSNYNDFNLYRSIPLLSFIRIFGPIGEYLIIILLLFIIITIITIVLCYNNNNNKNVSYKAVSIIDSSSEFEQQEEKMLIKL